MAVGVLLVVLIGQLFTGAPAGAVDAAAQVPSGELAQNGGFETGLAPWQEMPGTNFAVYANGELSPGDAAFSGTHYAAVNTSSAGGGIFENLTGLTITTGTTICGNAAIRNQLADTGASGSFVIWLLGGSKSENSASSFSQLGNGSNWEQVTTCATATTAHTEVRIAFYPSPGASTLDIDAVDVHYAVNAQQPVSQNGSFESGVTPWQDGPGTNFAVYANGQLSPGDTAFSGTHYAAVNTSSPGGGIYEDSALTINAGDTLCGTVEVRNQFNSQGASGSFVILLQGGSRSENGVASFSSLGKGPNWTQVSECVTANIAHSGVQIQFYPTPGAPTLDIDALSVHDELDPVDTAAAPVEAVNGLSSTATSPCTSTDSCTPQNVADILLSQPGIDAPITASNEFAIETWEMAEGGGAGCPGQPSQTSPWQDSTGPAGNPLNTTQAEPGSTIWNRIGVKIYGDGNGQTCWYWGLLATVQTLTGSIGNYAPIIAVLQNPVPDNQNQCDRVAQAVGRSDWGTGDFSADC